MKYALVTGGTRGIGLGIVKMLLNKGYFVTITYAENKLSVVTCQDSLTDYEGQFEILKADQGCKWEMQQLVSHLKNREKIDCIICNAGKTIRKSLHEIQDREWEDIMNINLNSNVFLIRDLYDIISTNSRIVFIGSLMGIYPHGTSLAYGVSKASVHALAVNLVKCFEETGTTVNAIAPGFVETEWQKSKPIEIRQNIYNKTAIKRFATVEEVAKAVEFCIDNAFVNGSIIEVSGGYCYK